MIQSFYIAGGQRSKEPVPGSAESSQHGHNEPLSVMRCCDKVQSVTTAAQMWGDDGQVSSDAVIINSDHCCD